MESILWAQNQTPTTPNTLILNGGEPRPYSSTKEQNDAILTLNKIRDNIKPVPEIEKLKNNNKISAGFYLHKTSRGFLIASCYEDKDNQERELPFMFYGESDNLEDVVDELSNQSEKLNRKLHKEEINLVIETYKKKKRGIKLCKKLAIVVLLFLALFVISLLINNQEHKESFQTNTQDTTNTISK